MTWVVQGVILSVCVCVWWRTLYMCKLRSISEVRTLIGGHTPHTHTHTSHNIRAKHTLSTIYSLKHKHISRAFSKYWLNLKYKGRIRPSMVLNCVPTNYILYPFVLIMIPKHFILSWRNNKNCATPPTDIANRLDNWSFAFVFNANPLC